MHFNQLTGIGPLLALVLEVVLAFCFLLFPLKKVYPDDRGDGGSLVLLPRPKIPTLWGVPAVIGVFTILFVLYHGLEQLSNPHLNPDLLYVRGVARLANTVVRAPTEVAGQFQGFVLGFRFLVFGAMVAVAIVGRGSLARRLLVVLQAVWFIVIMLLVDALLTVIEVLFNIPVAPSTLFGGFAALGIGFFAMARMLFANYSLPRATEVPFLPRKRLSDALTLILVTLASMAITTAAILAIYHAADANLRALLPVLLPLPVTEGTFALVAGFLAILSKLTEHPEVPAPGQTVPIDIIIPAYNEEDVIVDTLEHIDRAARRYNGVVTVIMTNDGSTDRTEELAVRTMRAFRFARGRVIQGQHLGKSAALNTALRETTSDICIRIDADTQITEWALYYTPRWFADPQIGLVEALMWARWRNSIFPHMRLFEELRQFGLTHRTIECVDGVNVVPGVFTAFRREVAFALNGFTVGMNGEDGDFTLRFSRLGYRSHLDPDVIVREDVPPTYMEIREQRIRWDRATIHNQARHGPFRGGFSTAKVWFTQFRQFYARMVSLMRLLLLAYLVLIATYEGTYRTIVVASIAAWFVSEAVFSLMELALTIAYRKTQHYAWVLLWPFWRICTNIFSVESWLSLPARPVGVRAVEEMKVEAVVH